MLVLSLVGRNWILCGGRRGLRTWLPPRLTSRIKRKDWTPITACVSTAAPSQKPPKGIERHKKDVGEDGRLKEGSLPSDNKRENMFTIPNILCVLRIGMTPFIANMIIHNQYGPAVGLLVVAGVTDLLDGWIARVVPGQATVMGTFLDPLADKLLVGTLFLSLTYMDLIPVPLTALIVGRDVILIAAGFYIRYQSLDPPKTFTRYFNVTLPTVQLAPTFISKVNTGLQLATLGATLASTLSSSIDFHPYLQILWYSTAATTIGSAVWYCFANDTVKFLKQTSSKIQFRGKKKI